MKNVTTSVIPIQQFTVQTSASTKIDHKAICLFAATGFFWETDTYWEHKKTLYPATSNEIDENHRLVSSYPYFKWNYTPKKNYSFEQALEEFTALFETIIDEQIGDQQAILPISGGLDSRTQAVALKHLNKKVTAYSYSFSGGYAESAIAKQIANVCIGYKDYSI